MTAGSRYGADRTDDTHPCPVGRCERLVPPDKLMCPGHWWMVPKPVRDAVWAAWQGGGGAGTLAHCAAIEAAIRSANRRLEAAAGTRGTR